MKQTRWLMGMPITVEIVDTVSPAVAGDTADAGVFDEVYDFFRYVDETFSPFKEDSEVSRVNRGELSLAEACQDMETILELAEQTYRESGGFFDIWHDGVFNPSGVVKGWAIDEAANILVRKDFSNFYIDAGGDIQVYGNNRHGRPWRIGICNPFNLEQTIKTLVLNEGGVATSGLYLRGPHIYNPHDEDDRLDEIVSMTVVGVDVCEADRLATAAFAMGPQGIYFIEGLPDCEGYMVDRHGRAVMTTAFCQYVASG